MQGTAGAPQGQEEAGPGGWSAGGRGAVCGSLGGQGRAELWDEMAWTLNYALST